MRHRRHHAGILCLFIAACSNAPTVTIESGAQLVGYEDPQTGVAAFLGVPYAQPPIGDLRWAAPQPLATRDTRRTVTQFAPACMQTTRILDWYRDMAQRFGAARDAYPDLAVAEDCLYLNVWTPSPVAGARLPVMVYIHGGSNKSGWSYEPPYHGQHLAAQGAVVVTVAYRLGVFGFLSHPQLVGEAVANFGLWDQLAALRWIQQNIARFGGDPEQTLVFGESAGGEDILALLFAEPAQGLIPRAALHSPAGFGLAQTSLAAERRRGAQLATSLNLKGPDSLAELRRIPAADLLHAYDGIFPDYYHSPVIDGQLLMRATWDSIRAGDNLKVPLLAGTNADEWLDSVAQNPTREDVTLQASQLKHIDAGRALAAVADEPDQRQALERIVTADEMLCPTQYALARTSELGGKAWMYFFTRVREGQAGKQVGAFHGAEYTYIFGTNYAGMPVTATDEALRAAMTSYWLAFARHGNPNATDLPDWPNYGAPDYRVQEFGDEVRTIARPEAALCESFDARHAGE